MTSAAHTAVVTKLDVSGAGTGTYTFTNQGGGVVRLSNAANTIHQDITLNATAQGTERTYNFSTFGISVTLMGSTAASETADELAGALAAKTVKSTAGAQAAWQVGEAAGDTFGVSFSQAVDSTTLLGVAAGAINATNVSTVAGTIDGQLRSLLTTIGSIGAQVNRLQSKADMLTTSVTNTQSAQSRIQDADIAKEQISAVKLQVLQQTAVAQLAQANQTPQVFLSLFR
jgi:flagellin